VETNVTGEMTMFRLVDLPTDVPGLLYLHSMPGRYEPFVEARAEIEQHRIGRVVCLAPLDEVHKKSPEYARVIEAGALPWAEEMFPVPDYGVPEDRDAFLKVAHSVAEWLQQGENVLIHCGAGIGRTGTLAICVLMVLGVEKSQAQATVKSAGSEPETPEQWELVEWSSNHLTA